MSTETSIWKKESAVTLKRKIYRKIPTVARWLAKSESNVGLVFFLVNYLLSYIFLLLLSKADSFFKSGRKCGKLSSSHNNNIIVQCDFLLFSDEGLFLGFYRTLGWMHNGYCPLITAKNLDWTAFSWLLDWFHCYGYKLPCWELI